MSTDRSCQKLVELQCGADGVRLRQRARIVHAVQVQQQPADRVGRAPAVIEQLRAVAVVCWVTSCSNALSKSAAGARGAETARSWPPAGSNTGGQREVAGCPCAAASRSRTVGRQIGQALLRRCFALVGQVVRRAGERVDGPNGRPQPRRAQQRRHRKVLVMIDAHGCDCPRVAAASAARVALSEARLAFDTDVITDRHIIIAVHPFAWHVHAEGPVLSGNRMRCARMPRPCCGSALCLAACSQPAHRTRAGAGGADDGGRHRERGAAFEFAAEVRARTESRLGFRVGGKMMRGRSSLGDTVRPARCWRGSIRRIATGAGCRPRRRRRRTANFDQAAADFHRYQELREQGFISCGRTRAPRDRATRRPSAQLDQAAGAAGVQGNQAAYATLVADVGGVITGVDVEPGTVWRPARRCCGWRRTARATPCLPCRKTRSADRPRRASRASRRPSGRLWGGRRAVLPARMREVSAAADPATRTFQVKADLGEGCRAACATARPPPCMMHSRRSAGVTKLPLSRLHQEQGPRAVWVVDRAMTVQVAAGRSGRCRRQRGRGRWRPEPGQRRGDGRRARAQPGQKVKLYASPARRPARRGADHAGSRCE